MQQAMRSVFEEFERKDGNLVQVLRTRGPCVGI